MYQELKLKSFRLESNYTFEELTVGYHVYGRLNAARTNVVWVCHGLTANSDVFDWWKGLFGENQLFNPDQYCVICVNALGSCYGTTGPSSSSVDRPALLEDFPLITTGDQARIFEALRSFLEIEKIYTLVGASLGGQQAIEWTIEQTEVIQNLVLIATNARHSAWGIAFNESQRLAIKLDPTYGNGLIDGGQNGLEVARSIAMLSYRSYAGYVRTQTDAENLTDNFAAASYQRYQGRKLSQRFDAYAYVTLTKAMDSHNVGRDRVSIGKALEQISARTLVIGISSDNLFPVEEQKLLALHIPQADFVQIESAFGHDGFLIETDRLSEVIRDFLDGSYRLIRHTIFKNTVKKNQLIHLAGK